MNRLQISERVAEVPDIQVDVGMSPPQSPRISHAVLLTGAQLARGLFRLIFVVSVARVLGPPGFGTYALLFAMSEILAVASGTGYRDYLTRETAVNRSLGWGLAQQLVLLRIALAFLIGSAELGVLRLLGYSPIVLGFAALMFCAVVPRSLSESVQGVLRGMQRYGGVLVVELAIGFGLVGGAGLLLARHGGMRIVVGTEIAAAAAGALVAGALAMRLRPGERTGLKFSRLLRTSTVFNAYALIVNLYDRLDVVMLSKLAGDYATGIYSAAYRGLDMLQMLPYGILYSLLPTVSRDAWGSAQREQLERAMGLLLSTSFFIVLAAMTFAGPAVRLLLGTRYEASILAVGILIWAVVLRYINYALNVGLLALRRERVFVVTSSVCLAVNVIGNAVFIPVFSWRAAAWMTIVTELCLLAQNFLWIRRALGSVPRPSGALRMSAVFVGALGFWLLGRHLLPPLMRGTVCLGAFSGYVCWSGEITKFARIWRVQASE